MTQPHDQFAKQYLSELLEPYGNVNVSREVHEASRLIDVYFSPTATATELHPLGLLGRMVSHPYCLLEPFRNQPTLAEVRNCILKLFSVHNDLQHRVRQNNNNRRCQRPNYHASGFWPPRRLTRCGPNLTPN